MGGRYIQFVAGQYVRVYGKVGVHREEGFARLFTVTGAIPTGCLGAAGMEGLLASFIFKHIVN